MGKHSNIILLNNNTRIIDSMRHLEVSSNSTRDILPTRAYTFPTTEKYNFLKINSFEEFYSTISQFIEEEPIDLLISSHFIGISKLLVSYLLETHTIKNTSVIKDDYYIIYNELKKLLLSNLQAIPYSFKDKEDYVVEATAEVSNINTFLDDFYSKKEASNEFLTYRNSVLKLILNELKKYNTRLVNMNKKLEECNRKDLYRIYGELITANLYKINPNKNLEFIELNNYYDNNKIIKIPLDKTISPSLNAKKFFKKYNKLKTACEIVTLQKEQTKQEIDYIESIIYELEAANTVSDIDSIYTEFSESFLGKNVYTSNKLSKKKISKKKKSLSL